MKHGEIYLADLDPTRGAEQAGRRPVLIFQAGLGDPVSPDTSAGSKQAYHQTRPSIQLNPHRG